jgi:hypothetical protein
MAIITETGVKLPLSFTDITGMTVNPYSCSIWYQGNKPFWTNGLTGATFSFYAAYLPLISHPVLALHLEGRDLGTDDTPGDSALLIDSNRMIHVGDAAEISRLVEAQHPRMNPETITAEELELIRLNMPEIELEKLGMFEIFCGISPQQQQLRDNLVAELDAQITDRVIDFYLNKPQYTQLRHLKAVFCG